MVNYTRNPVGTGFALVPPGDGGAIEGMSER